METIDLGKLNTILKGQRGEADLITALRRVQAEYGYVPSEAIALIAKALNVAQSRVYSVATFYDEFRAPTAAGQPLVEPMAKREPERKIDEQILAKERGVVLRNMGGINPEDIDSYISTGGYDALNKALTSMSPGESARLILSSGLEERDGGFLVGERWLSLAEASAEKKYVVGYASDKEPGISINEVLLIGDPHSLVEGMTIAAYAIGASQCYLYIPSEFTLALRRLELALKQARERGFLGSNNLNIEVRQGPRFLSCEPEIGVISLIEGNRASPGISSPFPQSPGLWGKPTFVGSAETFYSIPWIIQEGPDAFSQYGTESNHGTKVLALGGKLAHTGIAEVPLGISLRQLVFNIGGGIKEGHRFKAAHLGGPSGGCLPMELLDIPLDYHSLAELGLDFGSGSVVVLGGDACLVDLAKFFARFTFKHYCGACTPGRLGVKQMFDILTRISQGEGKEEDIQRLERVGNLMKEASLCAMCRAAANPVMTTVRYFRDEYEAHIWEKRCPAGVCPMSQA